MTTGQMAVRALSAVYLEKGVVSTPIPPFQTSLSSTDPSLLATIKILPHQRIHFLARLLLTTVPNGMHCQTCSKKNNENKLYMIKCQSVLSLFFLHLISGLVQSLVSAFPSNVSMLNGIYGICSQGSKHYPLYVKTPASNNPSLTDYYQFLSSGLNTTATRTTRSQLSGPILDFRENLWSYLLAFIPLLLPSSILAWSNVSVIIGQVLIHVALSKYRKNRRSCCE